MTHGTEKKIYSYDKGYVLGQITSIFTDEACPSLKGKPRIFFVQACRGREEDIGHWTKNTNHSRYKHNRKPKDKDHWMDHASSFESLNSSESEGEEDILHQPPIYKDFLVVRSAYVGHYSLRNTTTGTWFIQDLCTELEENGPKHDILNLLTHVNWSVSERVSTGINLKQILCISTMLTKILKFD